MGSQRATFMSFLVSIQDHAVHGLCVTLLLCHKIYILFSLSLCIICNVIFHSQDSHIKPFLSQGGTYTKPKTGKKKRQPNQQHILLEMQNSFFGPVFNRIPYVTSSKPCKTSLKTADLGPRTL